MRKPAEDVKKSSWIAYLQWHSGRISCTKESFRQNKTDWRQVGALSMKKQSSWEVGIHKMAWSDILSIEAFIHHSGTTETSILTAR